LVLILNSFVGNEDSFVVNFSLTVDNTDGNSDVNENNNQQSLSITIDSIADVSLRL